MESPITFSPKQDLGRYLQSLDSVRYAESDSIALRVQARVELFASLLFGQTVPIGEHQFLDSDGFIESAVDLIDSQKSIDNANDRRGVEGIFPFRVGIREAYSTIDNFIAIKLGDVNYKLSRWQSLDRKHEVRNEIKRRHEEGRFEFDDLYKMLPAERDAIDELRLVRDRFIGGEEGKFTTLYQTPTVSIAQQVPLLPRGLSEIVKWDEAFLSDQVDLRHKPGVGDIETRELFEPNLMAPAIELLERIRALDNAGVTFDNRSHIRRSESNSRAIVPEENLFGAILEIYDRLYNSAAAKAVDSHSEGVSSARNVQDDFIRAASALADLAIRYVTTIWDIKTSKSSDLEKPQWVHETDFGAMSETKEELVLSKMPWRIIWEAYLDPDWRRSLSRLNNAFLKWDSLIETPTWNPAEIMGVEHELDDAISRHVDNMTKLLSGSILQMHRESKTGKIVFDIVSTVGPAAAIGAQYVMNKLGIIGPPTPEFALAAAAIPAVGLSAKYTFPKAGAWRTSGQIRRMFREIYGPTR